MWQVKKSARGAPRDAAAPRTLEEHRLITIGDAGAFAKRDTHTDLKVELHQRLLDLINLSALDKMSREQIRGRRDIVQRAAKQKRRSIKPSASAVRRRLDELPVWANWSHAQGPNITLCRQRPPFLPIVRRPEPPPGASRTTDCFDHQRSVAVGDGRQSEQWSCRLATEVASKPSYRRWHRVPVVSKFARVKIVNDV